MILHDRVKPDRTVGESSEGPRFQVHESDWAGSPGRSNPDSPGWPDDPGLADRTIAGRMMLHAAPSRVLAGLVSLVAVNSGSRTHELLVLPLSAGATVGARTVRTDGTVPELGSLGEASRTCGAGSGDGISAGSAGWVTLILAPGRYELLCNLPGHYAAGMYRELDVR